MNILLILISIACIAIMIPAGATLMLSSRISQEECRAKELSVRDGENNA